MLDITMVRYAKDKVDSGGINESRTTELASQAVKLSFEFPTQDEVEAFECHPSICKGDLAYKKKFSREKTNETSRHVVAIMSKSTDENRSLWSYFLSRCSGRKLAKHFRQHGMKGNNMKSPLELRMGCFT